MNKKKRKDEKHAAHNEKKNTRKWRQILSNI